MPYKDRDVERANADFERAYKTNDTKKMLDIARFACAAAEGPELVKWLNRLKALEEGKKLKFSRAELREVR